MSYSNKYETGKDSQRREEEPKNMRTSKNTPSKASRIAPASYDNFGKNNVNSPCAFHPNEKITNFCTNKECLLPLCPKCVKIHTDEHIKMGIFGQFDTIEESLRLTEDGLRYSFEKLAELETLLADIKEAYETKIAEERRKLREAKNYFIEQIETVFDNYERALINIESKENGEFLEEMYNSEAIISHLSEHYNKCYKKIGNTQSLMEGIINYFSEAEQIDRVEMAEKKMQKLFPETINVVYHTQELERIESMVKRFLDINRYNDPVWAEYKKITAKPQQQTEKAKELKTELPRISPIKAIEERSTPQRNKEEPKFTPSYSKNTKISELGNLESNLNLGRFKSPLDNFSLANNRRVKQDGK